jgi:hypothetical protein
VCDWLIDELRGRVPSVPSDFGGPVTVAVVHADGVDLLFVTLDAVGSADVVPEQPGLGLVLAAVGQVVDGPARQERAAQGREVPVDAVALQELFLLGVERRFHLNIIYNYINR